MNLLLSCVVEWVGDGDVGKGGWRDDADKWGLPNDLTAKEAAGVWVQLCVSLCGMS